MISLEVCKKCKNRKDTPPSKGWSDADGSSFKLWEVNGMSCPTGENVGKYTNTPPKGCKCLLEQSVAAAVEKDNG